MGYNYPPISTTGFFLERLRRVRIALDRGGGGIGLYPKITLPAVMKFERPLRI